MGDSTDPLPSESKGDAVESKTAKPPRRTSSLEAASSSLQRAVSSSSLARVGSSSSIHKGSGHSSSSSSATSSLGQASATSSPTRRSSGRVIIGGDAALPPITDDVDHDKETKKKNDKQKSDNKNATNNHNKSKTKSSSDNKYKANDKPLSPNSKRSSLKDAKATVATTTKLDETKFQKRGSETNKAAGRGKATNGRFAKAKERMAQEQQGKNNNGNGSSGGDKPKSNHGRAVAPVPKPGSRWSMVDRDEIEKSPRPRTQPTFRQNHNNNSSSSSSSSNISMRTNSLSSSLRSNKPKILFLGDSFVRLFGLLKHPDIKVEGFKGASSKGLGREGNATRAAIIKLLKQFRPERIVLCFGSVDVHLSYYYTKYVKTEGSTIDLPSVAQAYIDFVGNTLKEFVPADKIHILGVYPSPLKPEHVQESLVAYGAITEEVQVSEEDCALDARQDRVKAFNATLESACKTHGLAFENAFDAVLDPETNRMKPSFQDVSSHNIHIVWETTVLLWMDRWPWFRSRAKPDFAASLQKTLDEYLATKPWAEAEHIAANVGVQGAFDSSQA